MTEQTAMSRGLDAIQDLFADAALIEYLTDTTHPVCRLMNAFEDLLRDYSNERKLRVSQRIQSQDPFAETALVGSTAPRVPNE